MIRLFVFLIASVAVLSTLRGDEALESILLGIVGLAICGSMIFLSGLWADYVLPFGFWESFASDARSPGRSAPAIGMLGWLMLALLVFASLAN